MTNDEQLQAALNPNASNISEDNPNTARDPVCGMLVDKHTAENTLAAPVNVAGQQTLYFCSAQCKTLFEQNPAQYGFTTL